jgi:hypothetical protein
MQPIWLCRGWEDAMFRLRNNPTVSALRKALETWTLRFLVIGITLILIENVGIAGIILQSFADPGLTNHFVFEIGIAFTVAAILILSSERVLKTEMEETFERYLGEIKQASVSDMDDIRNEYRSILRTLSNLHGFSYFLSDLKENVNSSTEMCTLASEILGDYTNGLKAIRDGFIIEERDWWLEVMKRFYTLLQQERYYGLDLEIRVTHPGPVGFWKRWEEVQDVLMAQRDAVEQNKITIRRVFVGQDQISPNLDDGTDHAEVITKMYEYKILRYYVQRQDPGMVRDITWVPALRFFIEWSRQGSVEKICIRSDANDRQELGAMWRTLMNDAEGCRGFQAQNNIEIEKEISARSLRSLGMAA